MTEILVHHTIKNKICFVLTKEIYLTNEPYLAQIQNTHTQLETEERQEDKDEEREEEEEDRYADSFDGYTHCCNKSI